MASRSRHAVVIGKGLLTGIVFAVTICDLWIVSRLVTYSPMITDPPINHLAESAVKSRGTIEARLTLGATASEAIADERREAVRTGMIPMLASMAAAGLVSLPGMMTGQILAGNPPAEAVRYQILIMFMIAAGTGFGVIAAVSIGARHLFDERARLRLDRLKR